MKRTIIAVTAILSGAALAACTPGDAEKAGERADSAYEEATEGQKDLADGPLENAGESVDRAAAEAREGAQGAGDAMKRESNEAAKDLEKATDGNPKT